MHLTIQFKFFSISFPIVAFESGECLNDKMIHWSEIAGYSLQSGSSEVVTSWFKLFKINVAGLSFKDGTGGVGAVICDRAGEVFAALSERVCDSLLIKRTCITPLSHIVQWSHVTEFSRVIVECEDTGMIMHLQM